MKPQTKQPWRKARRRAERGVDKGRRATHRAASNDPRPGSTWPRRHSWMVDGGAA